MEITGTVKKIGEVQSITDTFKKREFIITTEEQYPQVLSIEFVQDKTQILDGFKEGERVKVNINLRGREWTNSEGETKYFNTLQGWRIEKIGSNSPQEGSSFDYPGSENSSASSANVFNDLPF